MCSSCFFMCGFFCHSKHVTRLPIEVDPQSSVLYYMWRSIQDEKFEWNLGDSFEDLRRSRCEVPVLWTSRLLNVSLKWVPVGAKCPANPYTSRLPRLSGNWFWPSHRWLSAAKQVVWAKLLKAYSTLICYLKNQACKLLFGLWGSLCIKKNSSYLR